VVAIWGSRKQPPRFAFGVYFIARINIAAVAMSQTQIKNDKRTVGLINLGCAKNQVDSEEMLGLLKEEGHSVRFISSPQELASTTADVVIINTCAFIESAREESINTILEAVAQKQQGNVKKVVVVGCLAQRYPKELSEAIPEVDAFLGTGQIERVPNITQQVLIRPSQLVETVAHPHHRWVNVPTRVRWGTPWSAYLKISEGCDHTCTFCAIPSFRGRHVSKPFERIIEEAHQLAAQGVRELNLIAQDSTQYGYDLYKRPRLPELLKALSEIEELHWIRLFYCYPSRVNDELIETLATTQKICHYIDMPLQHADNAILRKMRRPMSYQGYIELLQKFRNAMPDAAIRTTFIVGFPGESEAHFATLERFLEEAQFDRVGVFTYSVEEGTPAATMRPKVSERVKMQRRERLMARQQTISYERNRRWIGRPLEVLIEGRSPLDPTTAVGRSFRDGPEVDGKVYVKRCFANPGTFITARITEARAYDLIGEPIESHTTTLPHSSLLSTAKHSTAS
jgi:ribosomal protein S12 methylthiotransferase